jgi:pimeloyl-ACP methyl ester carboxylesterase
VQTFNSDGIEIAYLDEAPAEGNGAAILLIHGFASNARTNWVDPGWVRHLSREGYRVIALDNRGHGASQKIHDPAAYHRSLMAEDARRLLDHIGVAQAHVMGYSMGARITASLALQHPGRMKTAIFGGLGINMIHGLPGADAIARALEAPSLDDVTDANARTFRVFADQTHSDRLSLAACIRATREVITAEDISRIACPVLVAVGTTDHVAGSGAQLAALIPGAQALDITGRDHMRAVGDRIYKDGVSAFLAQHK